MANGRAVRGRVETEKWTDPLDEKEWIVSGEKGWTVVSDPQWSSEIGVTDLRVDVAEGEVETVDGVDADGAGEVASASASLNVTVDQTKLLLVPVESSPSKSVREVAHTTGEQSRMTWMTS